VLFIIGYVGAGVAVILGAIVAVIFALTGTSCSSVEGKFTAKGKPITSFTMKPTACRSGERRSFHGVRRSGRLPGRRFPHWATSPGQLSCVLRRMRRTHRSQPRRTLTLAALAVAASPA
jgi:hypothetical protein